MKKIIAVLLALGILVGLAACGNETGTSMVSQSAPETEKPAEELSAEADPSIQEFSNVEEETEPAPYEPTPEELAQRAEIEEALNLKNNPEQAWTYSAAGDAWVLSVVSAVTAPELPDQQGVSVCVPGAYVLGIDVDGDGSADVTGEDGETTVQGALVINYEGEVTSSHGQSYTAATAPTILTTGAAGYGSQYNAVAGTSYASEGYISVACGNRGKQDAVEDENGNVLYYTGDAPSCLVDQKAAVRFVKYNMLLGNLPGSVDYFVSTGGSGGAAHATMFATTSNHPDFYDYQIAAGAVGVYRNSDGTYSTTVTIDGEQVSLSDGAWGSVAYSTISPLYEADMAQALEYYMDPTYEFNTEFQKTLAGYLAEAYMDYINGQGLTADEAQMGFDLNGDGDAEDLVPLSIEYDPEVYPQTNGYHGSYIDLYLCQFRNSFRGYLSKLEYSDGWTWFDENGIPLTDEAVEAMTEQDRAEAFIQGRYTKSAFGGMGHGGPGGMPMGDPPADLPLELFGGGIRDGGPMAGSTAASGGGADSANYASYEEMVEAYRTDVDEIYAGDEYGRNIVELYNPLNYIGEAGTENPAWTRIVMGAVEGDMSLLNSMNLQLKWLSAGVDSVIEWQWDGGHVPSEVLGDSLALYVDMMYGKYVSGVESVKEPATRQTVNGDAEEMSGTDLSGWITLEDGKANFTLEDVLVYRNSGAMKAVPGFDVIDYGQEDYVFGSSERDARHWNRYLLEIFQEHEADLAPLFNQG